mgnify:CR=1 FL=1
MRCELCERKLLNEEEVINHVCGIFEGFVR